MHPRHHAHSNPDKPALILEPGGKVTTYGELEEESNRVAHLFRSLGLKRGDVAAVFLENHSRYLQIAWGAQRSGLFLVCISSRFGASEVSYILADSGARILVQEGSNTVEWVPERVGINTNLREGDRVRLTIESPDTGFLYVIDRERYASGERGMPYLIFPTSRTRGGDNRVSGGKLIDIPGQDDRPNFFTLRHSRADQSEEELTVILTPEPLKGLDIGPKALPLATELVTGWEKQWGTGSVQRFELSGGAGKPGPVGIPVSGRPAPRYAGTATSIRSNT